MNAKLIAVGLIGLAAGVAGTTLYLKGPSQDAAPHVHPQPEAAAGREILYWTDPMLPGFRSPTPGKSPMGMEMVPVYADAGATEAGVVTVPAGVRQSLGVRTAKVTRGDLKTEISAPGTITVAPTAIARVQVRAAGWVERLAPIAVGAPVAKGERLFDLYAPDIHAAKVEFAAVTRFGGGGIVAPAENRLRLLGVPDADIAALKGGAPATRTSAILAPIAGVVDELAVTEGTYLEPAAVALTLVDTAQLWALLAVPQSRAAGLAPGLAASIHAVGGGRGDGVVDLVEPRADAATRAVAVRVKLTGPAPALRLGAAVEGRIALPGAAGATVLPAEALIRTGRENRVVLALGDGRFRSVAVETGLETDTGIEVRRGLTPGDEVVVSGQFLIDSDSALRAALARLDADGNQERVP